MRFRFQIRPESRTSSTESPKEGALAFTKHPYGFAPGEEDGAKADLQTLLNHDVCTALIGCFESPGASTPSSPPVHGVGSAWR